MAKPTPGLQRKIEAARFRRAAQAAEIDFVVFLAGPFIEPYDEAKSSNTAASLLRFRLFQLLQSAGYEVSLGEYRELIDSYKKELGNHHNAAAAELDHARDVASLVIMIPDSPGSFAEIGAFSMEKGICEKMIVLANAEHSGSTGYLNTGPVACARALGSEIAQVDYSKIDECFKVVKTFSDKVKSRVLLDMRIRA